MLNYLAGIYIFLFLTIFFAFLSTILSSIIITNIATGLFSSCCALLYFFLNSPDVAMTEVSIGVFLSSSFYLMTARITKSDESVKPSITKLLAVIICFFMISVCIYGSLSPIGNFGFISAALSGSSYYYIQSSYSVYHIPNIITTILASWRGFDTMGETIIILTAGIGVYTILRQEDFKYTKLHNC